MSSNTRCTRVALLSSWRRVRSPPLAARAVINGRPVGWIPLMMPFGLADILFSTLDFGCFIDTVRITLREMAKNLVHGKI